MKREISPVEQHSRWIFGSAHAVPVWSYIARVPVNETFLTREVARELRIGDSTVFPMISRLATINMVERLSDDVLRAKPNPWRRLNSELWVPLAATMDAVFEAAGEEPVTPSGL